MQREAQTISELFWRNFGGLIHHQNVEIKHLLLISLQRGSGVWGRHGTQGVVGCDLLECAQLSWLFVL